MIVIPSTTRDESGVATLLIMTCDVPGRTWRLPSGGISRRRPAGGGRLSVKGAVAAEVRSGRGVGCDGSGLSRGLYSDYRESSLGRPARESLHRAGTHGAGAVGYADDVLISRRARATAVPIPAISVIECRLGAVQGVRTGIRRVRCRLAPATVPVDRKASRLLLCWVTLLRSRESSEVVGSQGLAIGRRRAGRRDGAQTVASYGHAAYTLPRVTGGHETGCGWAGRHDGNVSPWAIGRRARSITPCRHARCPRPREQAVIATDVRTRSPDRPIALKASAVVEHELAISIAGTVSDDGRSRSAVPGDRIGAL